MDESVALDSSKQKDFVKSVRGIKKLLRKKNKKQGETQVIKTEPKAKENSDKIKKDGKVKKHRTRGLVYLSHIPHGFYEQQMTEYFKQFGVVTNARVIRSRRTGNSRGFAFVEFKEPAVAEIVAETMNNYLMGKRLIKAVYIPPNKQKKNALRKNWNAQNNPSSDERLMFKKKHNADKSDAEELKMAKKLLLNLSKTKQKLRVLGIEYDFFKPVDVPEDLKDNLDEVIAQTEIKLKKEENDKEIKSEPKEVNVDVKTNKTKKNQTKKQNSNNDLPNSSINVAKQSTDTIEKGKFKDENKREGKKINTEHQNQQQKKNNLKKAGVDSPENFVSIKKSDDTDSSIDFDSDEFEKMIEEESESVDSVLEDEVIKEMTKILTKKTAKGSKNKGIANVDLRIQRKQDKGNRPLKRKTAQSTVVTVKKTKFEKQNSKRPQNKVFKNQV